MVLRTDRDPSIRPAPGGDSVSRRRFLALVAWGAASALIPGTAQAGRTKITGARRIRFQNLHTGERCDACYWEHGAYIPSALEQIDAILRDHRTGEVRQIAPGLIDLVYALTIRLRSASPVQVISGYRSPATNALLHAGDPAGVAENSLHLTGKAMDLAFESKPLRRIRDAALSLRGGGVGYYPESGFVHLDIGRVRRW